MSNFYFKILLPTIVTIILFILAIFIIIIPHFQQNIMNGKREMIKELTNSSWSILSKYECDERSGLLTREEAQKTAVSRIQYLRYGEENKDYFWITDMYPTMIMHPYRSDLNGKDLTNVSDPHGKKLFVEFVKTVKQSDNGYVDYMWQWKDDSLHIVPKLSYVRIFKPWGWVIGTGIYIEDVKKEIKALTKKMLWIAIGISVLIALLLLFISQQSLKIEQKRIQAEDELQESKEKYKTLVEAATEGLIMLIDGKISFSNNVISMMTEYKNDEILNRSFNDIISPNNHQKTVDEFSKNIVSEGQYEINLKKKNGGFIEVLATSSAAVLYNKTVNIITVKDITIERNSMDADFNYQKLISTINIGVFRAKIDTNGKFINADETTIRLLGYNNFNELSEIHIFDLLENSDERKNLKETLLKNGFVKNRILRIHRNNNSQSIVIVTLVGLNIENSNDLICDGIIEDITLEENKRTELNHLITQLKSTNFIFEQSVKYYQSTVNTVDADTTINNIIKILSVKKTNNLLLTKNGKDCIGIVTNSDIQERVLLLNIHLENPAYLIMSSPIVYIKENTSVYDAITISEQKNIHHLVVRNELDEITGVIDTNDVYKSFKKSLSFFITSIAKAETIHELKQHYNALQLFIKPLINNEISVKHITNITSSFSDSVIQRVIDLTIQEIGNPPVEFSFICLGSEGRKEETIYTDQDNAIIYDDVPKEKEKLVSNYFNTLGERVCNSLNQIGYSFCKGNIMAKNPQWCKPISVWKNYFTNWITTPEPQNLLEATIFFDFRNIYGNEIFVESIRSTINILKQEQSLFLYHLAYNTYNTKPTQISAGTIISDKNADFIDLKSAINHIVMFTRTYSLQNNIWCSNTIDRLNALKEKQIINSNTIDEIIFSYNFLMKLRFKNQIILSDNQIPLSNILNTKKILDIELSILKKVLSFIPSYQNKISVDFRLAT